MGVRKRGKESKRHTIENQGRGFGKHIGGFDGGSEHRMQKPRREGVRASSSIDSADGKLLDAIAMGSLVGDREIDDLEGLLVCTKPGRPGFPACL